MHETLLQDAKAVLTANQTDLFTKSAINDHSYQCSWDAGFMTLAYAHYDFKRATQELRYLFKGQWINGMLPHLILTKNSTASYLGNPDFWAIDEAIFAPDAVDTSGIVSPPIHGFVLWHLYIKNKDKAEARAFLQEMFPKIVAQHRYFYENRDPLNEGLITIRHPWESGMNNSPLWDKTLDSIDFSPSAIPTFEGNNLQNIADTLGHSDTYLTERYIYLIDLFRRNKYNEEVINTACPFQVQDPLFNSLLVWSNECLIEMGQLLGENIAEIDAWNELTIYSMNDKLWDAERGMYNAFDVFNQKKIICHSSAGLLPLLAGIPSYEDSEIMLRNYLYAGFRGNGKENIWLYPTYNLTATDASYTQQARGAIEINMNWLMIQGLRKYNINKPAAQLRLHTLELIKKHGFFEYFDSRQSVTENGFGAKDFSVSAAVIIDLLKE